MGIMKACSGAVGSKGSIFTSKWIRMGSLNPCESSQRKCSLVKPNPPSLASSAPIFKRVSGNSFLGSYQCYTRGFQTIPESIPVSETNQTSSSSKEHSLDSNLKVSERRDLPMIFTCKVCEVRSTKAVCRESYEKGVVVARCDGCNNFHLIADRLGLLGESSVEEFLAARGEDVRKGSFETFNLTLKDLAGAGSSLSDYALSEADPIVRYIIDDEKNSQCTRLELTASENYTSRAVMEAVGSCLTNNCSIGSSGKSYSIKSLESVCHDWALEAFHLKEKKWGVNFQTLSGSSPNFEVYEAILSPRDRIMGLDLPHGFISDERRVSGTPTCFESMPYRLDESTGLIDYDMLEKTATSFRPKLIIAGASAHPRDVDYPRMRKIADAVGAFLMMDMAHISGLVSASVVANPFDFCDIVTTTTHKSLRGPRGGMIFFKKGTVLGVNLESAINNAVLPGLQGGPHFPTIGGIAVSLNHAKTPEFKAYQNKMVSNSRALAGRLVELGYELVTGGTDNHLVLVDLRPLGIDGARVERILGNASITLSKNFVPGDDDKSAVVPGGILIGSSAMTIRGFKEHDFIQVADFIHEGVQITLKANASATGSELKDFMKFNIYSEIPLRDRVRDLCGRVRELITPFPIPGL